MKTQRASMTSTTVFLIATGLSFNAIAPEVESQDPKQTTIIEDSKQKSPDKKTTTNPKKDKKTEHICGVTIRCLTA